MTTVISNEFLNTLLRKGEGVASLTGRPEIGEIVSGDRRLLQRAQWVPLEDALRAIIACAQRLISASTSPDRSPVAVDRDCLERLLMCLACLEPVQRDLLEPKRPLEQQIKADQKVVRACHATAASIASKLEKHPRTSFESYAEMLSRSPDPAVTLRVLSQAGKGPSALVDAQGPLPAIEKPVVTTLPAQALVDLRVRIVRVDDRTDLAVVERLEALDLQSEQLMVHHQKECDLRFDGETIERADLTAAQYLNAPIRIRCAAECAILPDLARKSSLTLAKVLEARDVMDQLHDTSRPFQLKLGDVD